MPPTFLTEVGPRPELAERYGVLNVKLLLLILDMDMLSEQKQMLVILMERFVSLTISIQRVRFAP